ncbi:MAG: ubiquinol-cytochrome c reductase iron-sulfur subunit [Alphaproteobacteria bacterium]|nr:ubiquinol-cytochrome c reductase iron-sulfur subunit [Alphaproteobacteria bacterium]
MADEQNSAADETNRRDFLYLATGAFAAIGAANIAWPLIHQMNPDASVKALASIEVDLSAIETGQSITVTWRGKPVFIRRRTAGEIADARTVADADLPDPQNDAERVQKDEWLVMVGICTHLGCVPLGQAGDFNGWFCPCHGSHYDTSGRIRKGPAPKNLEIPSYEFVGDSRIKIG